MGNNKRFQEICVITYETEVRENARNKNTWESFFFFFMEKVTRKYTDEIIMVKKENYNWPHFNAVIQIQPCLWYTGPKMEENDDKLGCIRETFGRLPETLIIRVVSSNMRKNTK